MAPQPDRQNSRPFLVPSAQRAPARHTPLALWHLLSLDAPSVAALWTWFVARACHLALPWTAPASMFLAVWMLYVADRLLDARPLASAPAGLEERHRFHDRHRRPLLAACGLASIALVPLLHVALPAALHLYTLLAVLLGAYLLLIHAGSPASAHRLPKELAVGIFFPAAVFIPTVARLPQLRLPLLAPALLLAAVCTLNCLCVYAWEHTFDARSAHWTTRWGTRHLRALASTIALLALLTACFSASPPLALACMLSALLLLALDAARTRFSRVHQRALADLALLSPLLLLWLQR